MLVEHIIFDVLCLFFLCFRFCYQISCKDEQNEDVDWYVNFKLPKIDEEPSGSSLAEGKAYAYITAPGSSSWKLSSKTIMSGSMLKNTMKEFYSNKRSLSYLFYNDDPPSGYSGSTEGHLKGVIAFDGDTGFWLTHSLPKFGDPKKYRYPDNALDSGQSILCVTFRTEELNNICNQLVYSHPNIYTHHLTEEVEEQLDDNARSLFTDNPIFVTEEPFTRIATLKSAANKCFKSFAKDNQFEEDLYSDVIAPSLKSSLLTETWRRGRGKILSPTCRSDYSVLHVEGIEMTFPGRKRNNKRIIIKSTNDHSKWAIAEDRNKNWICIADLNRMGSQAKRGGGALCFDSAPVKKAYMSIIAETDECSRSRSNRK